MAAVIVASFAAVLSFIAAWLGIKNTNRDLTQQLTFEGIRDKRVIYATALAALKKYEIARTEQNETAARIAIGAVALVAQRPVWETARNTLELLCDQPGSAFIASWDQMVQAMRTDLGVKEPWEPAP
jgi:hypothetical protein